MLEEASMELMQAAYQTSNEADKRLLVLFSYQPHQNREKTAKEGRPIFEDREYVMIMVPGDKESIVHRPASEMDINRFPAQYQKFKNKQSQETAAGTPLKLIPMLTASQIKELEYFNCYTVEQLAELPDGNAHKFQNGQSLKKLAKDYLATAKGMAPTVQLRKELSERDNQLAAANQQLAALAKRLEKLEAKEAA